MDRKKTLPLSRPPTGSCGWERRPGEPSAGRRVHGPWKSVRTVREPRKTVSTILGGPYTNSAECSFGWISASPKTVPSKVFMGLVAGGLAPPSVGPRWQTWVCYCSGVRPRRAGAGRSRRAEDQANPNARATFERSRAIGDDTVAEAHCAGARVRSP